MYNPTQHIEKDLPTLHAMMRANPLGAWVTLGADGLIANHVPFMVDETQGEFGTLRCHVARANPVWQSFSKHTPSIVLFQGPQAYVTPSWYPSKHAHGKAVPTWNYAVVHAHGLPVVKDEAWLRSFLDDLTRTHEQSQALPWNVSDAPTDYIDRLVGMIVGIEIPITSLDGKWKMHQHASVGDKLGVVAGLTARGDAASAAVAQLVHRHVKPSA